MQAILTNNWFDIGHEDKYYNSKLEVRAREFNHITIDKNRGILKKTSDDNQEKGILLISIGVTIIGMAVAFINHFLWLKYSIIIAILILLIMKRNTVINIVKNMLGKKK